MSQSVALVSAVDPYPTDAGKKVVLAGFLEYLTERLGGHSVHYLMVGGQAGRPFPAELHPLPKPRSFAALGSVLTRSVTGRASLQESLLRTREMKEAIHRTLDRISPALEIYDTVRMAQHAPGHATRQICYLDDLFSERYRAMLVAADRYPDVDIQPLGNFAAHVPRPLRPLAGYPPSQRALLRFEQHLVRHSEDRAAHRFGTTLLLNEREVDLLRDRSGVNGGRVQAIPPLISKPSLVTRDYRGAPHFVFLGWLALPHNEDGLRSFLRNVWPRVLAAHSDARLSVVGRDPRPALIDVVGQHADTVTLEGFVPDLGAMLGSKAAMINPLRFGSGVKLKVIEALGAGLPVISTSIGADGIASGADNGVLIADADAELAEHLLDAVNITRNAELSAAARDHFARRYSRDAVFACYDAAFGLG